MDERLKKRLIGAVVLVALLVIFVPMLVEDDERERIGISETNIPPRPDLEAEFAAEVLPDPDQPRITPLPDPEPPEQVPEDPVGFSWEPAASPAPAVRRPAPPPEGLAEPPRTAAPGQPRQMPTPTPAAPKVESAKATPSPAPQERPAAPPPPEPAREAKPPQAAKPTQDRTPAQQAKPVQQAKAPTAPPSAGTGLYAWVVQVASFASRQRAEELVRRLRSEGFPAFQEQAYVSKRIMYRVRVGPGSDRKRTERMAARLADRFKIEGSVVRYP